MEFSIGDKVVSKLESSFKGIGTVTEVVKDTFGFQIVQVDHRQPPDDSVVSEHYFSRNLKLARTEHHPSVQHLLDLFDFAHLPPHLQVVSEPCHRLAHEMADRLDDGIELTAALRHLLYGKDSFVRQAVIDERNRRATSDADQD